MTTKPRHLRTWFENERDYHADLGVWWLKRATDGNPNGGKWEGEEAAHHISQAAHYDRLQHWYERRLAEGPA